MKLIFFSDTHNRHAELSFPKGDVLICCGDFSSSGKIPEVQDFANHLKQLNYKKKIVIAGNHDFSFEDHRKEQAEQILHQAGIIYLNDSGIEIDGYYFWGSPIQPTFFNWAFNRKRGATINKHWDLIPEHTDVLITHGPPYMILDRCNDGARVGCQDLLNKVRRVKPRIHAFGHIHEAYGTQRIDGTIFVNASALDHRYRVTNPCIELEL